jgi:RNA polymerase sigma-70 factor (ECF subfamily)
LGRSESNLRRLSDEELMGRVADGEQQALEIVYERHASVAFSLAYRMVGARSSAEDVVQEAFLSVWRAAGRYDRTRGSVRTWVLGIVHNRAIDMLRRNVANERRRASDEGLAERVASEERTDAEVQRREDARSVRGVLDALPPEQIRVIELAYYGGFSHSEIAELLEMPIGTVKGRMRLGLEKLRTRAEEGGLGV